jgi:hypothetical protein
MKCKEFKNISLLFIDNELSEELKSSAIDHLSSCDACKLYIQHINSIYSKAENIIKNKKTDLYFYTRLKARMELETAYKRKGIQQLSYYIQPAFYILIAFTLFFSILIISGNIKNKQQTDPTITLANTTDEQDYIKAIAMNEQTFEEDYINMINK